MKKRKLIYHLFLSYLAIVLIAVTVLVWFTNRSLKEFYYQNKTADLQARAILVQQLLSEEDLGNITRLTQICRDLGASSGTRITIILPSGQVIGDSHEDPTVMDNHGDRPEIIAALHGATGTSVRYSHTLDQEMMYLAIPTVIGGQQLVVRTSLPVTTLQETISAIQSEILAGGLIIVLIAAVMSFLVSKMIARPLEKMKQGAERFARGELDHKLAVPNTEEIGSLAASLNQMACQLDERIKTIESQRSEKEAILSSMVEGVIAVDRDERILSLNPAVYELLQIDLEQAIGKSIQEVFRNSELLGFIQTVLAKGEVAETKISITQPDERHLKLTGTVLKDGERKKIGAVIVLDDITRIYQLENLRKEFVANVSHELKTPITSIKGFVETLREGAIDNPQEATRFLEIIGKHADRLDAIINDLLELSRIEQQERKGDIELIPTPVGEVLELAVQACQQPADQKRISLRIVADEEIKAPINAPLIQQALVNLIDNAIKYSDPGSEIIVSARREQNRVVMSVQDFGIGIARKHFDRLFERFYRVDRARSRTLGGTGLGLAIVKHIAHIHGGDVSVDSTVGEGSTFAILLPV
jgi:two-component system phosphate regulon sensor histidine kinase PhoR